MHTWKGTAVHAPKSNPLKIVLLISHHGLKLKTYTDTNKQANVVFSVLKNLTTCINPYRRGGARITEWRMPLFCLVPKCFNATQIKI